jgi:hypothetical protein
MRPTEVIKKYPGWTVIIATGVLLASGITALDTITRWWSSHETAYAAYQEVETLESVVDRYIRAQEEAEASRRGYEQALQEWTQQQMRQSAPDHWVEYDEDGNPYCTDGYSWWWC